jgi:hypothetical protein
MLQTLHELEAARRVDRIAIYTRGDVVLYENTYRSTGWTQKPTAREVVEAERAKEWSAREKVDFVRGWQRVFEQRGARKAGRDDLTLARGWRNRALVDVYMDPGARAGLAEHLSASQRQGLERTTAAAVFELLPQPEAVRIFSALAPYFAERDRLGRASPAALERLSAQLERSFPKPPEHQRSRGRGR